MKKLTYIVNASREGVLYRISASDYMSLVKEVLDRHDITIQLEKEFAADDPEWYAELVACGEIE